MTASAGAVHTVAGIGLIGRRTTVGAERDRVQTFGKLEDGLRQADDWYLWGPYVSERQWGTVREDYSADGEAWDVPAARARAVPGVPLGRGRTRRFLRRRAAALSGSGAVERARPDPQGAPVRSDRRGGQPRRGRQGILVVPRRRAQPRLESVALPLSRKQRFRTRTCSSRTAAGASSIRSTSCWTPGRSTTTATGSSTCTTSRRIRSTC